MAIVDAPYVETNREMLGDKHLDPKEAVIREREELLKIAATRKIGGQSELEDSGRSAGPRLFYTEILRRLHGLNPRLMVREGLKGNVAIYRPKRIDEYDISEMDLQAPKDAAWFWDHKYVTGMAKDWLPEYSHVTVDSSMLPVREIRGWRSVLIALVKSGSITRAQCNASFGDPSCDQRSRRWFEQVGNFK